MSNNGIVSKGLHTVLIIPKDFKKTNFSWEVTMFVNTHIGNEMAKFIVKININCLAFSYSNGVRPSLNTSAKLFVKYSPHKKAIIPITEYIIKNKPLTFATPISSPFFCIWSSI